MKPPTASTILVHLLAGSALTCGLPAQWTCEYPLDQNSGTTAFDISPSGNHGTLINFGGSQWVTGRFGNALRFAANVDDYVQLPATSPQLPVYDGRGSPYSITYWIKAPNVGDNQGGNVYTEGHDNTPGLRALFMLHGGGAGGDKVRLLIRTNQPRNVVLGESNAAVYDDTWHHVAVTEASGAISIYVDGVLDTTLSYFNGRAPGSPGYTAFDFNRFSIGAVVRGSGIIDELDGTIDDFRIYDYQLSAADVATVMTGAPLLPTRSSIAEYGFGCGTGPFDLVASGSAAIGGPGVQLQMQAGTPNAAAFLLFDVGQITLFDLGSLGFAGCTLYPTAPDAVAVGALNASGSAPPVLIPVPNNPSLSFLRVNFQAVAIDGATGNAELSDAAVVMVGR